MSITNQLKLLSTLQHNLTVKMFREMLQFRFHRHSTNVNDHISQHPYLTPAIVAEMRDDVQWRIEDICRNPNFTLADLKLIMDMLIKQVGHSDCEIKCDTDDDIVMIYHTQNIFTCSCDCECDDCVHGVWIDRLIKNTPYHRIPLAILPRVSGIHIPSSFIIEHPEIKWRYNQLARVGSLNVSFIDEHPEIEWKFDQLARMPNLTMEFIERHLDQFMPHASELSSNLSLDIKFIVEHTPLSGWNWNYAHVANRSDITAGCFRTHMLQWINGSSPYMHTLYYNKFITWNDIVANIDQFGSLGYVERHDGRKIIDVVKQHPTLNWDYDKLSESVKFSDIIMNRHLPWVVDQVYFYNRTIEYNDIVKCPAGINGGYRMNSVVVNWNQCIANGHIRWYLNHESVKSVEIEYIIKLRSQLKLRLAKWAVEQWKYYMHRPGGSMYQRAYNEVQQICNS